MNRRVWKKGLNLWIKKKHPGLFRKPEKSLSLGYIYITEITSELGKMINEFDTDLAVTHAVLTSLILPLDVSKKSLLKNV